MSADSSLTFDPRQALEHAASLCERRGTRLTELRKRVLEIIWNSPTPLGAYAILDVLRDDGRQGAPPTVYRALDFLLEQGLIHRLASLNVFTGCRRPDSFHGGQFLICRDCGQVDELTNPTVEELLRAEAACRRFEVLSQMVEVLGRCPDCQRGAKARDR
ncbi:MAG TPA: Fur family transcriptional regulator [Candidatus Competibacter sp.]|nr:Fur family transcriptional regulator [Candidatus Competibacter sp.]HUM93997.1 Fur family transcriptional regulator [Candidatus Competibacter sp.]